MIVDIVMFTRNRLPLLQRTLSHLFERTTSPYRLYVIDDGSDEGNAVYLQGLFDEGKLAGLFLRREGAQFLANWKLAPWIGESEIMVLSDDDILCPRLDPDWLARGLEALATYPRVGLLAPTCPSRPPAIHDELPLGPLMICDKIGTTLTMVRRALFRELVSSIGPDGELGGIIVPRDSTQLSTAWVRAAHTRGFRAAYMMDVYCQHIGAVSARNGEDLSGRMVEPMDLDTLCPPPGWRE